jgi:hypothetical protein
MVENTQISGFMKISPVGDELLRADTRTDRQTDMTTLEVTLRNFAKAPKIQSVNAV